MMSGDDTSHIFKVNTTRDLGLTVWPVQHEIGRSQKARRTMDCLCSFIRDGPGAVGWTVRTVESLGRSPQDFGFRAHIPQRQSPSSQHPAHVVVGTVRILRYAMRLMPNICTTRMCYVRIKVGFFLKFLLARGMFARSLYDIENFLSDILVLLYIC